MAADRGPPKRDPDGCDDGHCTGRRQSLPTPREGSAPPHGGGHGPTCVGDIAGDPPGGGTGGRAVRKLAVTAVLALPGARPIPAGLIDILLFPEQWNSEDPRIARQLLADQGIQFTAQELQQLKQQKTRPTKLKKTRIEQLSNYFLVLIIVIFVLLLLWKY